MAAAEAIVTLGFGFIIKILAINNPQITNGAIGLNDIPQQPHLLFWPEQEMRLLRNIVQPDGAVGDLRVVNGEDLDDKPKAEGDNGFRSSHISCSGADCSPCWPPA